MATKRAEPVNGYAKARSSRTKIPEAMATEALFLSDNQCCVCHDRARGVQLHHVDGDHENHDISNLAALCSDHHDHASRKGGLTRKLNASLILRFRDDWLATVRARRERERGDQAPAAPTSAEAPRHETNRGPDHQLLDALAIHEIRKIEYELLRAPNRWERKLEILEPLGFFAERHGYSPTVTEAILTAVGTLTGKAQLGMDAFTAEQVSSLIQTALPIASLVGPEWRPRTPAEIAALRHGACLGFELAHHGAKRLHDLGVVDAGAEVLWTVLRHATLNGDTELAGETRTRFDQVRGTSLERGFPEAARWIEHKKSEALDVRDEGPRAPQDLERAIWVAVREAERKRKPASVPSGRGRP